MIRWYKRGFGAAESLRRVRRSSLLGLFVTLGSLVVAAWLGAIVVNLLTYAPPKYYDIALRDFGLFLAALTLNRLAVAYEGITQIAPERPIALWVGDQGAEHFASRKRREPQRFIRGDSRIAVLGPEMFGASGKRME